MDAASCYAQAEGLEQKARDCAPEDRKRWLDAADSWRLLAVTLEHMAAMAAPLLMEPPPRKAPPFGLRETR